MKSALYMLSLLALCTACGKSDPPTDPGQLDKLLKVTMANGDVIYASPEDNSPVLPWGPISDIVALTNQPTGAAAVMDFNGEANTAAIVAQLGTNGGTAYAAKVCADLVAYGFDDWYLPAAGELYEMYLKLGPNGSKQIVVSDSHVYYWSSSERDKSNVWLQNFENDEQEIYDGKSPTNRCRCIRR